MAWDNIKYTDISTEAVQDYKRKIISILSEYYPDVDFERGAIHGILVQSLAVAFAMQKVLIERVKASQSLTALAEKAGNASEDLAEWFLENFGLTRRRATKAHGKIGIILSEASPIYIPAGTEFSTDANLLFDSSIKNIFATEDIVVLAEFLVKTI